MENFETPLRNMNRGYMKLIVSQKALQLFEVVWTIAFVESKIDVKLRSQFADAAQSISANISEGYGRRSAKEYIQFLYVALGSMAEIMTRAIGRARTGQIADAHFQEFDPIHYEVENRLLRLIEKLKRKRDDGDWTARIAEDPSEYLSGPSITPSFHHSIIPSFHHSIAPSL
jgi:four helix bundle protein